MSDKQKNFPTVSSIRIDYIPEPEFRFTVHFNDKQDGEKSKQVLKRCKLFNGHGKVQKINCIAYTNNLTKNKTR